MDDLLPSTVPRNELAKVFGSPRLIVAFENTSKNTSMLADGVNNAQVAADGAQSDATTALGGVEDLKLPTYLTLSGANVLANERKIAFGGPGWSFTDGGAGDFFTIMFNVLTALGYVPANRAGDTFTGPVTVQGSIDVQGQARCDSLRIDQNPTATTTASTHSIPVNLNGTTYYIRLSSTP